MTAPWRVLNAEARADDDGVRTEAQGNARGCACGDATARTCVLDLVVHVKR